ncbi:MAG: 30S ribosomal protein S20 [Elusimicrobia bacterium]|nr:30S ribosomal protein S20 [Elusimicrobiota bacterium]
MAKKKQTRHKSALKAGRQALKRWLRNRDIKKSVRSAVRAVVDAAKAKDVGRIAEMTAKASAVLDKAAQSGVLHWKAAARKKSRLAAQARKLVASAAAK